MSSAQRETSKHSQSSTSWPEPCLPASGLSVPHRHTSLVNHSLLNSLQPLCLWGLGFVHIPQWGEQNKDREELHEEVPKGPDLGCSGAMMAGHAGLGAFHKKAKQDGRGCAGSSRGQQARTSYLSSILKEKPKPGQSQRKGSWPREEKVSTETSLPKT